MRLEIQFNNKIHVLFLIGFYCQLMFFFFPPLPQLIQDAAACRDNIMEAVEVVQKDPVLQKWKKFFEGYAEDAGRLKPEYTDTFNHS